MDANLYSAASLDNWSQVTQNCLGKLEVMDRDRVMSVSKESGFREPVEACLKHDAVRSSPSSAGVQLFLPGLDSFRRQVTKASHDEADTRPLFGLVSVSLEVIIATRQTL